MAYAKAGSARQGLPVYTTNKFSSMHIQWHEVKNKTVHFINEDDAYAECQHRESEQASLRVALEQQVHSIIKRTYLKRH